MPKSQRIFKKRKVVRVINKKTINRNIDTSNAVKDGTQREAAIPSSEYVHNAITTNGILNSVNTTENQEISNEERTWKEDSSLTDEMQLPLLKLKQKHILDAIEFQRILFETRRNILEVQEKKAREELEAVRKRSKLQMYILQEEATRKGITIPSDLYEP